MSVPRLDVRPRRNAVGGAQYVGRRGFRTRRLSVTPGCGCALGRLFVRQPRAIAGTIRTRDVVVIRPVRRVGNRHVEHGANDSLRRSVQLEVDLPKLFGVLSLSAGASTAGPAFAV